MNLYKVNIREPHWTGIFGETFHVQAGSAKIAMERAYRKMEKRYPKESLNLTLHRLELIEEDV